MQATAPLRDPWVSGGLVLLLFLTVGVAFLYRSAPQSVAEARSRTLVAVRPSAYTPRFARAEEQLRTARTAAQSGDTASAVRGYAAGAEEAWVARGLAATEAERSAATELWATALLDRADLMLRAASSPWWRRDDDAMLRDALASVERVRATPASPVSRRRADALSQEIRRQLQPGPLEWIPRR